MGDQPLWAAAVRQPPVQPQSASAGAKWGPTSMGMESHIAAGLSYFFTPILPLIFFLMEKNNKFVQFHAMQSMILGVARSFILYCPFIVECGIAITGGIGRW